MEHIRTHPGCGFEICAARRDRPGWHEDVAALCAALSALPPARTLDVACGTGFLTAHLPGEVTGLDQSEGMLAVAAGRLPRGRFVRGDALDPPSVAGAFERVHAAHFYGHLDARQRRDFLVTAGGLAPELGGGETLHDGPWFVAVRRLAGKPAQRSVSLK